MALTVSWPLCSRELCHLDGFPLGIHPQQTARQAAAARARPPSAVQNIAAVGRSIEVVAETQQSLRERVRRR